MRRYLYSLLVLLLCGFGSFGQDHSVPVFNKMERTKTKENWAGIVIPDNTVFGVRFVVDSARLGGISYAERIEIDPEVESEFEGMIMRCVTAANKFFKIGATTRARTFHFSPKYEGKKYTITFHVKDVSEYGYTVSDVIISADGKIASILNLKGKGGLFGSFANLMGDGFESLGRKLAVSMDYVVYRGFIKEK